MKSTQLVRTVDEMISLIKKHKITSYRISKEAGVSVNTVNGLLTKDTTPRSSTLLKLDSFLLEEFPLTDNKPNQVLDKIPPDIIVSYLFDNLEGRFKDSTALRMLKNLLISDFKVDFLKETNQELVQVLKKFDPPPYGKSEN